MKKFSVGIFLISVFGAFAPILGQNVAGDDTVTSIFQSFTFGGGVNTNSIRTDAAYNIEYHVGTYLVKYFSTSIGTGLHFVKSQTGGIPLLVTFGIYFSEDQCFYLLGSGGAAITTGNRSGNLAAIARSSFGYRFEPYGTTSFCIEPYASVNSYSYYDARMQYGVLLRWIFQ
jgi:hypothetical protein